MIDRIDIQEVALHRNGICGESFYAITFLWTNEGEARPMVATVFDPDGVTEDDEGRTRWPSGFHNPRIAVLDMGLLPNVTFGENSWRGDHFTEVLYKAIRDNQREVAIAVGTWEGS